MRNYEIVLYGAGYSGSNANLSVTAASLSDAVTSGEVDKLLPRTKIGSAAGYWLDEVRLSQCDPARRVGGKTYADIVVSSRAMPLAGEDTKAVRSNMHLNGTPKVTVIGHVVCEPIDVPEDLVVYSRAN